MLGTKLHQYYKKKNITLCESKLYVTLNIVFSVVSMHAKEYDVTYW